VEADAGLDRRIERIEEIVRLLDSDSLGLDDALALFEEGVAHLRHAQETLARAELRVEELIGAGGDEIRPLETPGTARDVGDDA